MVFVSLEGLKLQWHISLFEVVVLSVGNNIPVLDLIHYVILWGTYFNFMKINQILAWNALWENWEQGVGLMYLAFSSGGTGGGGGGGALSWEAQVFLCAFGSHIENDFCGRCTSVVTSKKKRTQKVGSRGAPVQNVCPLSCSYNPDWEHPCHTLCCLCVQEVLCATWGIKGLGYPVYWQDTRIRISWASLFVIQWLPLGNMQVV